MEKKKSKTRMIIVLLFIAIFAICSYVSLRGTYLQYKELGENYIQAFETNLKCKYIIFGINFVLLYIIMYFTNRGIKKGLKPFFEKEKKEMPKLLNKSISFVTSVIVSTLLSNTLMKQFLLCASNTSFGINDPVFGFDIAFYMFQKPFIQTLLLYFIGIIIGLIGGIFTTFRNPSGYTASSTTIEKLVGLEGNFENIFPKIIILILATALLMFYVLRYSKNHMTNKIVKKVEHNEEDKNDEVKEEKKEEIKTVKKEETKTTKKVPTKNSKKKTSKNPNMRAAKKDDTIIVKKGVRTWPLVVVCALMLVLLILGFIPWQSLFEITVFDDFHTWLTGISIGDYSIFNNIMSANFTAFGTWGNLGSYMMPMILIIIFSIIIAIIYRIKLSDMLDYFKEGAKKMLPSAMMAMLAYTVLVCTYNNGFMETIISKANVDNIMLSSLLTILGSITNVDLYYTAAGIFTPIVGALSDNANLNVFALVFQSFYGLIQLFGPTSILLIFGLTYFEVPYKDWLKNIWRLILGLFIIIFLVVLIVALV